MSRAGKHRAKRAGRAGRSGRAGGRRMGRRAFLTGAGAAAVGLGLWLRRGWLNGGDPASAPPAAGGQDAPAAGEWRAV